MLAVQLPAQLTGVPWTVLQHRSINTIVVHKPDALWIVHLCCVDGMVFRQLKCLSIAGLSQQLMPCMHWSCCACWPLASIWAYHCASELWARRMMHTSA